MSNGPHRLVVHGAAGRMGQRIVACALAEPDHWQLVAALDAAGHSKTGQDAGQLAGAGEAGVAVTDVWDEQA
ncbi:MAG: 4-hydroxy-tetrahydrodipicolinate reductase, partial [Planctomycetia bacterium]|nr:4-hydroxy-tetrahydrodipicolinate reductase [Planctomycetia bacterium]